MTDEVRPKDIIELIDRLRPEQKYSDTPEYQVQSGLPMLYYDIEMGKKYWMIKEDK